MRYAQIDNGVVIAVRSYPEGMAPFDHIADPNSEAAPGGGWTVGGGFTAPPTSEPTIEEKRANTSKPKIELCAALVAGGYLTEAEAEGWLAGVPPAAALAAINALSVEERLLAKFSDTVARNSPLVAIFAPLVGVTTDAQVDALFGIT